MATLRQLPQQHTLPEERATLLVVDDDPSNALVLQMLLQSETPYRVRCFSTGREVLQQVEEVKALMPVLFLLDYQLESLTGLDLYHQLSRCEGLEQIPAILITGHKRTEDLECALAEDTSLILIQKPYDIDEIVAAVQQLVVREL